MVTEMACMVTEMACTVTEMVLYGYKYGIVWIQIGF